MSSKKKADTEEPRVRYKPKKLKKKLKKSEPEQVHTDKKAIVPNQSFDSNTRCYHLSAGENGNEICSMEFPISSHLSSLYFKDFHIGRIVGYNYFQNEMSRRASDAIKLAHFPRFQGYKRIYGHNKTFDLEERKAFISSGCNHLWQEKFYGISRVAVYGVDSVCVVTRSKDVMQLEKDKTRLWGSGYITFGNLSQALINEVKVLACPPDKQHSVNGKRRRPPFALVSVIAGTNKFHKANHHEADEVKAIEFLREEMNSTSTFTFHEAVKTAIGAYQLLWDKKFQPTEFKVFFWKKVWIRNEHDDIIYSDSDGEVEELKICEERSIKDILAVMNDEPHNFIDSDVEVEELKICDSDGEVEELKICEERSIKDILAVINDEPHNFIDSAML